MKPLSVAFKAFGCKVNQYEVDKIRSALVRGGFQESDDFESSSLVVINTCAVTGEAFGECVRFARKVRRRNTSAKIIVTGCAVTSDKQAFDSSGDFLLFDNKSKDSILDFMRDNYGVIPDDSFVTSLTTRYFLKIQDGCDLNCSYCIIPSLRGPSRSVPYETVMSEFKSLLSHGYKEIVLTGVHIGSYGRDIGTSLTELIRKIISSDGRFRIRISSIEADEVKDDLIGLFSENHTKLCPHLHLPLQSGSNKVLSDMRRRYNKKMYMKIIDQLCKSVPDFAFTTDIIVGFPTEGDEEFRDTLDTVKDVGFHRIHIFPYSPRDGTDSARLKDLHHIIKRRRIEKLSSLACEVFERYARRFIGRKVELLTENDGKGYTQHYLRGRLESHAGQNEFIACNVSDVYGKELICSQGQ